MNGGLNHALEHLYGSDRDDPAEDAAERARDGRYSR
jgi:hypothetical protein